MGDMSSREFFSSPTRYLAQAISKESEFEKPYLDDDRGKMHMDWPWPDWPPFPDIPPWPPWSPPDGPVPGLPGCAILCYEPSDCDDPIWCHPGIWCGTDIGCTLCTWVVEGATSGYTPHLSGVGSWGIDVWIDSNLVEEGGEALVRICMTDPCGNECCSDVEVGCKKCPPEIVISWDDVNSAETIVREGNAGVYVKDGLGPYTWSVAGTGFSMLHNETTTLYNTLQADATACGPATITVTDFCGDSTEGIVRCTEGQWTFSYRCAACSSSTPYSPCSGIGYAGCTPPHADIIDGKTLWDFDASGYEYWNTDEDCPPFWYGGQTTDCPYQNTCLGAPPCGTPTGCGSGTSSGPTRTCYALRVRKYQWTC